MIKDIFKFKKTAWHMKLIHWVWGFSYHDFRNMCPYFWLTVFTVLFIPVILIVKSIIELFRLIGGLISAIWSDVQDYCDKKQDNWAETFYAKLQDDIANKRYSIEVQRYLQFDKIKFERGISSKFWKVRYLLGWEDREKLEKLINFKPIEKVAKPIIPAKTKAQVIGTMTIWIKYILKGLLFCVGLVGLYLFYKLIAYMITLNWGYIFNSIINSLPFIGQTLLYTLILTILVFSVIYLMRKLACYFNDYCSPCEYRKYKLYKFFSKLGYWFIIPFIWLVDGGVFLWELIVSIKKDNCPGLEWED